MEDNNILCTYETRKEIGDTVYIVKSVFSKNARETAETKLLRLMSDSINGLLQYPENL